VPRWVRSAGVPRRSALQDEAVLPGVRPGPDARTLTAASRSRPPLPRLRPLRVVCRSLRPMLETLQAQTVPIRSRAANQQVTARVAEGRLVQHHAYPTYFHHLAQRIAGERPHPHRSARPRVQRQSIQRRGADSSRCPALECSTRAHADVMALQKVGVLSYRLCL